MCNFQIPHHEGPPVEYSEGDCAPLLHLPNVMYLNGHVKVSSAFKCV